ncbi:MAG: N-acetyltransferase [Ktedonobacteraceae bacterium]|nr:N-acetyltransferase [Ktedonobacteraceae bacterium]MBA3824319.1 N-acetyltransferase [Ktedonobacterales bacterium]
MPPFIHATAEVSAEATIGDDTRIWNHSKVREGATIGSECNIGQNVYIDFAVSVGSRVKIQNNVSIYHGVTIESGVFIGPHVCFCNDRIPRAITPDGHLKSAADWHVSPITVGYGASIGARSVIVPGVTIGRFAMIGAGSVVSRSVPDYALVYGNPARIQGYVCECGQKLQSVELVDEQLTGYCPTCDRTLTLFAQELASSH